MISHKTSISTIVLHGLKRKRYVPLHICMRAAGTYILYLTKCSGNLREVHVLNSKTKEHFFMTEL